MARGTQQHNIEHALHPPHSLPESTVYYSLVLVGSSQATARTMPLLRSKGRPDEMIICGAKDPVKGCLHIRCDRRAVPD